MRNAGVAWLYASLVMLGRDAYLSRLNTDLAGSRLNGGIGRNAALDTSLGQNIVLMMNTGLRNCVPMVLLALNGCERWEPHV